MDIIYNVRKWSWAGHINHLKDDRWTSRVTAWRPYDKKDDKGDQPSGGETTWTNTGATRYGRGQHKTGSFGDEMLRPSPNHGTQRLPNDDDDVKNGTVSPCNTVTSPLWSLLPSPTGDRNSEVPLYLQIYNINFL